jgi:hypothetical protein
MDRSVRGPRPPTVTHTLDAIIWGTLCDEAGCRLVKVKLHGSAYDDDSWCVGFHHPSNPMHGGYAEGHDERAILGAWEGYAAVSVDADDLSAVRG